MQEDVEPEPEKEVPQVESVPGEYPVFVDFVFLEGDVLGHKCGMWIIQLII